MELEPGGGTSIATPRTPLWSRDRAKNSFSAAWNSCSQPGLIRRVMATWTGCEVKLAAISEKKGDGCGEIVHVAAAGPVDITPGDEMHVRRLHVEVPLKLPR